MRKNPQVLKSMLSYLLQILFDRIKQRKGGGVDGEMGVAERKADLSCVLVLHFATDIRTQGKIRSKILEIFYLQDIQQ